MAEYTEGPIGSIRDCLAGGLSVRALGLECYFRNVAITRAAKFQPYREARQSASGLVTRTPDGPIGHSHRDQGAQFALAFSDQELPV